MCAYVTDLCVFVGNLTVFVAVKLNELQACGNTCKVSALVDRSKCVLKVFKSFGVCLCAGCVAELHVFEFLCCLNQVRLVAE